MPVQAVVVRYIESAAVDGYDVFEGQHWILLLHLARAKDDTEKHLCVCVCVCARARERACVCLCLNVYSPLLPPSQAHARGRARLVSEMPFTRTAPGADVGGAEASS